MREATMPVKRKSKGIVLISILLAAILGAGGYFGVWYAMTGQSPLDIISNDFVPISDIPTDGNGNNLIGNHMQNLYNGGFMAMQGSDVFFVNFSDGGSLYCQNRNGVITKLTDFPVANLNVSGNRLAFTDLEYCSFFDENDKLVSISAKSHEEVWSAAGEDAHIGYGGRLYLFLNIKDFCAGKISYDDLLFIGLDGPERYQSPIMLENGSMLLITASDGVDHDIANPTSVSAPQSMNLQAMVKPLVLSSGGIETHLLAGPGIEKQSFKSLTLNRMGSCGRNQEIKLKLDNTAVIRSSGVLDGIVYIETFNEFAMGEMPVHMIIKIDLATGQILGTVSGRALQVTENGAYFKSGDSIIHCDPVTGNTSLVNGSPCQSEEFTPHPNGDVSYKSRDKEKNTDVPMLAVKKEGQNSWDTKREVSNEHVHGVKLLFGSDAYSWSPQRGWERLEKVGFQSDKRDRIPLNNWNKQGYGGEKGPDWVSPDKLPEIFERASDGGVVDPDCNPSSQSSSSQNTQGWKDNVSTTGDMARQLTAIIRMLQGYDYNEHGEIDMAYRPDHYQRVFDFLEEWFKSEEKFEQELTDQLVEDWQLQGHEKQVREYVRFWAREYEFAVNECVIYKDANGEREFAGNAQLVTSGRVHVSYQVIADYILANADQYPGGRNALIKAGHAEVIRWGKDKVLEMFNAPRQSGLFKKELTTQTIEMEFILPDIEWVPIEHRIEHFVTVDANYSLPEPEEEKASGGGLDGTWQRTIVPSEQIVFKGDTIKWTMGGKVITAGTFKIDGGSIIIDSGAQGTLTKDFSQNGDTINIGNWTYVKK